MIISDHVNLKKEIVLVSVFLREYSLYIRASFSLSQLKELLQINFGNAIWRWKKLHIYSIHIQTYKNRQTDTEILQILF